MRGLPVIPFYGIAGVFVVSEMKEVIVMKKVGIFLLAAVLLFVCVGCGGSERASIAGATCLADLKGARIAAQAGTFHADALPQIEDVKSATYPEFSDLLTALKSGAIDGYIAEEPTAKSVCLSDDTLTYIPLKNNDTGFKATAADVGIAIGLKEGSPLRDLINAALAGVTEEQKQTLMSAMMALANGDAIDPAALLPVDDTAFTDVLKVGMECAYEPYNWTETKSGTLGEVAISGEGKEGLFANGYDVQMARYVAASLGKKLEIYAYEWDSLLPAVQSGAIDAIVAGMSPTAEREEEIDFTNTYYESNLVVICKK